MGDFFQIIAAGPFFFVSSWVLMIFGGIVGTDIGIRPFGYITSKIQREIERQSRSSR